MKIALFNGNRVGLVEGDTLLDVTSAVPGWDGGFAANFWVRLCARFDELRPKLGSAARTAQRVPLSAAKLDAAALNPQKIIAAASNYEAHRQEMIDRRSAPAGSDQWLYDFDVFLKSPSSVIGPEATLLLPEVEGEVHHEGELAFVIGKQGKNIDASQALDYVLGYTTLIDVTVRGGGDRSRRKSYDGFSPIGPWLVTADEIGDPHQLRIQLWVNSKPRQDAWSGDMLTNIPGMIAYASRVMTLYPGDVFTTGSPPGVGKIEDGDVITTEIEKIGRMNVYVRKARGGMGEA